MQKSTEELYITMHRGVATAAVADVVGAKIRERMASGVQEAIRRFRSLERPYTPEAALLFVASLAAQQTILDDLERDISDGQRAGQQLIR